MKKVIFSILIFLMALVWVCFPLAAQQENTMSPGWGEYASFQSEGDIRRFLGETLFFDISFLWFQNAASAQVGFYEKDGTYYALLDAQTKGFIGFFTAYRRHIYKTTFDIVDDGKRVRAKRFMREVIDGGKMERSDHFFDYDKRIHNWVEYVNEDVVETGKEEIPPGINFDDVLTAFYNFRNGVYGKVEKGKIYTIKTIPEKGSNEISVDIKDLQLESQVRQGEGRNSKREEYLMDLIVPKEVFKTDTGRLRFWASKHLIPIESTISDYAFLGDLHAVFSKRDYPSQDITSSKIPDPALSPSLQ